MDALSQVPMSHSSARLICAGRSKHQTTPCFLAYTTELNQETACLVSRDAKYVRAHVPAIIHLILDILSHGFT